MEKLAYTDLTDSSYVFEALLGYGMFSEKLPPCFTSENIYNYLKNKELDKTKPYAAVDYWATKNTNSSRLISIPHPKAHWNVCKKIQENWGNINKIVGNLERKHNYCHVRKIQGKKYIFNMNYSGFDKFKKEENIVDYLLASEYVVSADISNCFPSIYSHSLPWAIRGTSWSKVHQCTSQKKSKNKGLHCKKYNDACPNEKGELWCNDLDEAVRNSKSGETNGLLIGPHTSNIISEIVLTNVDGFLEVSGFNNFVRHIDDYEYFASSEEDAKLFLRQLDIELKKFELSLNAKKTKIVKIESLSHVSWINNLSQYYFPNKYEIGFNSVKSYLDYAFALSKKYDDSAVLNYAIKVLSKKKLSKRARRLYVKSIMFYSVNNFYLLPLLEEYVFSMAEETQEIFLDFLDILMSRAISTGRGYGIAFSFYFALKHSVKVDIETEKQHKILETNDCIAMTIAYKYLKESGNSTNLFRDKANEIVSNTEREQEKNWIFLYEVLPKSVLKDNFLKDLKSNNIEIWKI